MTRTERLALLAALGLIALFLTPVLGTPFLEDDTYNNYIDGWLGYEHLSFAHGLELLFRDSNLSNGRFYPVFPLLMLSEFHLIHSAPPLKLLVVAAILVNAATFWLLLRRIAPASATPALVLLPATFQMRFYSDPIVAFSLHMQLALEFVLLGFLGLVAFGKSGRGVFLALGTISYALACLTYEATYAYALAFVALARECVAGVRARWVAIVAFVAIPVAFAAVALAIRTRVVMAANSVYRVHWDPGAIVTAFVHEVAGGFPLIYASLDPGHFLPPLLEITRVLGLSGAALALFAAALAFFTLGKGDAPLGKGDTTLGKGDTTLGRGNATLGKSDAPAGWRFALLFGALLATLPAVLIVLSARQQRELVWGFAYTPVYMQYFGVALVLGILADALARRGVALRALVACALAFVVGTTWSANRLTLGHYAVYYGTTVLPSAIDAGLLADAPEGARLYVDESYPANLQLDGGTWNTRYFYYYHTAKYQAARVAAGESGEGKRFQTLGLETLAQSPGPRQFAVLGAFAGGAIGAAAAGAVAAVARGPAGEPVPMVERARRYANDAGGSRLQSVAPRCGLVTLASVLAGAPSGVSVAFGEGFFPEERDANARWRWTSRSSELTLENLTERPRKVKLRFILRPAVAAAAAARIGWPGSVQRLELHGDDVLVERVVPLGPRERLAIPLEVAGSPYQPPRDPRLLLFQVRNFELGEAACAGGERDAVPVDRRSGS